MFTLSADCIKIVVCFDGQTTKFKKSFENMSAANLADHWNWNTMKCFVNFMRTQ